MLQISVPTRDGSVLRHALAALRLTRAHLFRYLAVILVLQSINYLVIIPVIGALFSRALHSAGLRQVTDQSIGALIASPISDLLLLLIAVIALVGLTVQLSTVLAMVDRQQSGTPLTISGIAAATGRALHRVLNYQSPVLWVYFFLLAPIGGLGLMSVLTQGVAIPPFVTREFMKTPAGGIGYSAALAILGYVNLRLILTLPMIVVGDRRPVHALFESLRMTRRGFWRFALLIAMPVLATAAVGTILVEVLVGFTGVVGQLAPQASAIVASISITAGHVIGFLLVGAATVVIAHILVAACRERVGEPALDPRAHVRSRTRRAAAARVGARVAIVSVVLAGGVAAAPLRAQADPAAANTIVLAHRGWSSGGVENTIGALDAAAKLHPEYVETDMQQTKDGLFVASHDSNLLMVAGLNENIYDLTAAQATKVVETEGGFTGTIPTMKEYVERAAELHQPLLIELKVSGHESADYIDRFLAELDAAGATDQNIYHSLNPDAVRGLKERRPELRVGLTIAMSIGGVPAIDCDFFVIEQASFSSAFLDGAHAQGKPVYVWTVNDPVKIRDFMRAGVDGIVTDHPDVALTSRTQIAEPGQTTERVADALSYLDVLR